MEIILPHFQGPSQARPIQTDAPSIPLMTREAFALAIGLPLGVLTAQAERGYWPQITIGRRVFINVEAVRIRAAERAEHFVLSGA